MSEVESSGNKKIQRINSPISRHITKIVYANGRDIKVSFLIGRGHRERDSLWGT